MLIAQDLEGYAKAYGKYGRYARLKYIVDKAHGETHAQLRAEALLLLLKAAKEIVNPQAYQKYSEVLASHVSQYASRLPDFVVPEFDRIWVERAVKEVQQKKEMLEQEVHQSKVTQIKESMRLALLNQSELMMASGDYVNAMRCLHKSREHCSDAAHLLQYCMRGLVVAVCGQTFQELQMLTSRVHTIQLKTDADVAHTQAAQGVYFMRTGRFRDAATCFMSVKASHLSGSPQDAVAVHDVAVYGALCAMAAFERTEISQRFGESAAFRETLDFVPLFRDIALDFSQCKYASALTQLRQWGGAVELDLVAGPLVPKLLRQIRERAIVQYVSPFIAVSLDTMAEALNTQADELEADVARLVEQKTIPAKIDAQQRVVRKTISNPRTAAFRTALDMGNDFVQETETLLLKMSCFRANVLVKPPRRQQMQAQQMR
uniref:PCI domain-containing protein n=1 Tax=Chromera velia CCMP2878 TaxID=1169474 RepID=A0A0G4FFE3_9ALVE|mmetsp:Transcript_4185/g.8512  ORF Transcript_4185/g.8512 Transcript_4185/m.8512 type:complete len:432 (-) Transcript_4185:202-1497(-)|eukprot:Cvel_16589.t1-p1 / transcript=Cvel_16589.t1 / gene=Cvel_16589 / organism=Chromera_velia_CCMP2878 / gene_product=COP9 signalosome complex subunit 1, putative / transcript_product=COP9 signalosome complex subunit 1, putative / location=Cvel_scaffold1284:36815-39202(-) / protein_length=431 / sequence_SO=supercontig / SO=protein_coding / is_pseudo=false